MRGQIAPTVNGQMELGSQSRVGGRPRLLSRTWIPASPRPQPLQPADRSFTCLYNRWVKHGIMTSHRLATSKSILEGVLQSLGFEKKKKKNKKLSI